MSLPSHLPPACAMSRIVCRVIVGVLVAAHTLPLGAQRTTEFSRQDLLIPLFQGSNPRLARAVSDEVRGRLGKLVDKDEVSLLRGYSIDAEQYRSGFNARKPLDARMLQVLARTMRADEYLRGTVDSTRDGIRATAALILTRNARLIQPLPTIVGRDVAVVGAQLTAAILEARQQLIPHRRCENAVRLGDGRTALAAARAGVALYPRGTLLRICLVVASLIGGTPANEILDETNAVLDVLPDNYWALDATAQSYDALRQRDKAARAWLRVLATDSTNLELVVRVGRALAEHDNAATAEEFVVRAADAHNEDIALQRLRFDVLFRNKRWDSALAAGLRLDTLDLAAQRDSLFHLRLATVYRSLGRPVLALETAARAVARFPGDARLYELYAQLVLDESPVVVARGLEAFPNSAPLSVMQSRQLRTAGKPADAQAALRRALDLDGALVHGFLQLAQSQVELGQPDSALLSLHWALDTGEDSTTVDQFALARGNTMFRAAGQTQRRDEFARAFRYLAFADSVRPSAQTRFLYGASALSVLQSAAADAPSRKSCTLARQAQELLPLATEKLTAGAAVAPDAVRQYLKRLDDMTPIIDKQVGALCPAVTGPALPPPIP